MTQNRKGQFAISLIATLVLPLATTFSLTPPAAQAQGPVPVINTGVHARPISIRPNKVGSVSKHKRDVHHFPGSVSIKSKKKGGKSKAPKKQAPPPPPQAFVGSLSQVTLAPGVVHKVHRGAMYINLLDIDLKKANVCVKPVLAGETFNKLDEVRDQALKVNALAAVNGNYFKRDGTPLGTLIIDGEWIAGPLFDRTCLGITDDGRILVDRVKLHGVLETSNLDVRNIWINNINQPRRHDCHIIAYTRRWGDIVKMDYDGTLIAVDATGRIVGKTPRIIGVPPGGFVLSDSKTSPIAQLNVGDIVKLSWQTSPSEWSHVVHAVSGGPVLIRDGELLVDLQGENFRKSWTSSTIHARTAVGVTADRHLLLATIEGPHTLYDVAKFLKKLGAVDAMNLDGGGSTTMVIGGNTVTKNQSHFQRRVASSLVVLPRAAGQGQSSAYRGAAPNYIPATDLSDFGAPEASDYGTAPNQPGGNYQQQLPNASFSYPTPGGSYELMNVPPAENVPSATVVNATEETGPKSLFQVMNDPRQKSQGRFGWVKKLNPLDW